MREHVLTDPDLMGGRPPTRVGVACTAHLAPSEVVVFERPRWFGPASDVYRVEQVSERPLNILPRIASHKASWTITARLHGELLRT